MKVKARSDLFVSVSCVIMLLYANYNTLIDSVIGTKLRMVWLFGGLCIGLFPYYMNGIKRKHISVVPLILMTSFIGLIIFDNNYDIREGTFFFTFRIIIALMLMAYINIDGNWITKIPKIIAAVGSLNIFATYFFFIFRKAYTIMFRFYGFYPTGTKGGQLGYRAGIANHYSQNATYIVYVFIAITVLTITEQNKKRKRIYAFMSAITFFALILTGKRAHLLFSIMALLGNYFLITKGNKLIKSIKLMLTAGAGVSVFYLLGQFVKPIADLLERFSTAGTDSESTTRFAMWELCLEKFKTHPIFGVGWAQFPQLYYENLYVWWYDDKYKFLNAHNVYFQLLCEVGIVGFLIFLLIISYNLVVTVRTYWRIAQYSSIIPEEYTQLLSCSITMQLFFLIYCVTGNGLYDYSFFYYMIAVTSGVALHNQIRRMVPELHRTKRIVFCG